MIQENIFYVYIYLDPRKLGKYQYENFSLLYEPFYVGKGKNNRIYAHLNQNICNNLHKHNKINKILLDNYDLKKYIIKIRENLFEKDALFLEEQVIKEIGRYDLKKGPLTNLTDGGESGNGCVYTEEQNKANSERIKKWIKDNPEKQLEIIEKRNIAKNKESVLEKQKQSLKKWMEENPEKYKEREEKRIKSIRSEKGRKNNSDGQKRRFKDLKERQKQSNRTKEWTKNNPEKHLERQRKSTETKRKNAALKKPIKEECNKLIEEYNLDVVKPHPNCSVEKWETFFQYLKTIVFAV